MTPTPPDKDEIDEILLGLDLGDASEGLRVLLEKESMNSKNFQRAKQAINRLIAKERLDELKLATVGRVTNKNKKNLTYMSGFGYAANNLQEHKNTRLTALQAQAEKEEQG